MLVPVKSLVLCFLVLCILPTVCLHMFVCRIMKFLSRIHCVKVKVDRMHLTAFQDDAQEEETSVQLSVSATVHRVGQSE